MSLFSEGINMKGNSSCAKNIPKNPKHRRQKWQAQDLLVQVEENICLLFNIDFQFDLSNLGTTSISKVKNKVNVQSFCMFC